MYKKPCKSVTAASLKLYKISENVKLPLISIHNELNNKTILHKICTILTQTLQFINIKNAYVFAYKIKQCKNNVKNIQTSFSSIFRYLQHEF